MLGSGSALCVGGGGALHLLRGTCAVRRDDKVLTGLFLGFKKVLYLTHRNFL